jgi:ubiquinone/menaquinone biosynthesis C-methylase UbiE
MDNLRLPDIRIPGDMKPDEMPDLLRYWYLGPRARRHMMLRRFEEVDREIGGDSSGRVLDVGSAWGYNVMALSLLGIKAVAMDLVVDQFASGQRVARENGLDFAALGGDAACLPFGDRTFNGITMVEVLEHVYEDDRPVMLRECHRVLAPGGTLVLSTPNYGSLVERFKRVVVKHAWLRKRLPTMCYPAEDVARSEYHPYQYHRPSSADRISRQLEDAGFTVRKSKYFLFVLKNTPDVLFPLLSMMERIVEKTPLLSRLAATLCLVAVKSR